MKKIVIICILLISILSISVVSAQENSTDIIDVTQTEDVSDDILNEGISDEMLSEDVSDDILNEGISDEMLSEDVNDEILKDYSIPGVETGSEYVEGVESLNNYINVLTPFGDAELNKIEIYIDGIYYRNYTIVDFMGTPFSPWGYSVGEHVITAKYNGIYEPFEVNTTFRVVEVAIDIPYKSNVDSPSSIGIRTMQCGNVTVYINGTQYKTQNITQNDIDLTQGNPGSIYLENLKCGLYEIKVVFSRNSDNFETTKTGILNVTYPMYLLYSLMDNENYYYNATLQMPNGVKNTPIAIIEGKTYTFEKIPSSNYGISLNLSDLPTGHYYVNITYPGDDKYPQKTIIVNITVKKFPNINTNITVEYGMPIIVNLTSENETDISYVYTYWNNNGVSIWGSGNKVCFDNLIDLGGGEFAYFSVGEKFNSIFLEELNKMIDFKITIIPAKTNITADVEDITYTEIATINITGTAYGNVIVKIDGNNTKSINITENTTVPVTFENISAGKHNVSVILKPISKNYNESTYNTEFNVFKKQPTINIVNEEKIIEGDTLTVNVTVPNATGKIKINGKEANLVDNKVSVELSDLILGYNIITVIYDGDENNLNATSTSQVIIVAKEKPKNVTIIIDGITYSVELVNGTAIINTNKTEPKKASQLADIVIDNDQKISFILKDEDGEVIGNAPITYEINGKKNTIKSDKEGKFIIAGKNNALIAINYAGNENINGINTTIKLNNPVTPTVVKVESQFNITGGVITLNGYAVDTKAGEEGMYYATELLEADGNPIKGAKIQFAVNDKIYNRTTNENGSFNPYKLNMVRAGRYTMAFYFAGNDNYTGAFASVCVDLDKKPIKIKAGDKSYKVSATKKYTVTLSTKVCSSHDGKVYLSPRTVTLTVNGKTYTGKTNSGGKVTFKITNLSKKAKYKARISYEGDATYESATKTVTLTVN